MNTQKNVLLVTNATTEHEITQIKEAFTQAQTQNLSIKLSLVCVIPTLPVCYFNIPSMLLLVEKYYDEAKRSLAVIGKSLGVSPKDQWLITGKIKNEVIRLANRLHTNFILASSTTIHDLHKSFLFTKEHGLTPIRNINHVNSALKHD